MVILDMHVEYLVCLPSNSGSLQFLHLRASMRAFAMRDAKRTQS